MVVNKTVHFFRLDLGRLGFERGHIPRCRKCAGMQQ